MSKLDLSSIPRGELEELYRRSITFRINAENTIERLRAVLQKIASLELTGGAAANAAQDALQQ